MNGNNICIILSHPDESKNVGAVCRAMANNDIKDLRIIGKKTDYDESQVKTLSVHAFYIWENAKFYENLQQSLQDCCMAGGTTRRRGKKRKDFLIFPEEFADLVCKLAPYNAEVPNGLQVDVAKVALVFGNERAGLSDEELDCCTVGVNIPSCDDFGSLNLSHAVQIMCYTFFRKFCKQKNGYTPVNLARLDNTLKVMTDSLEKIGFFKLTDDEYMKNFWRGIFSRACLTESEAKYIEKIFTKIMGLYLKHVFH
ncbi:MAG: RNA methyltransferase [Treponemataceae bacterium]